MEEGEVKTKIGEIREVDSNTDASIGPPEGMKQGVSWIDEIESHRERYVHEEVQRPKIQGVPTTFRSIESNKKCFDPMVIAIGPLHHGKEKLQRMETYKIKFALKFAEKSNKSMQDLYKLVEKQAIDARKCYANGLTNKLDDKEFAKMMFLDGCFVLQFIYSYLNYDKVAVDMMAIDMMFVYRDIALLENQLPFEFLKALMKLSVEKEEEGEEMIDDFVCRLFLEEDDDDSREENARCWKSCWKRKPDPESEGDEKEKEEPVHLLDLVRTKFVDVVEIAGGFSWSPFSSRRSYRSVTELKSVGINFKCSSSRRFSDITFECGRLSSGCLRLPPITIDYATESLLLNLVAWEACLNDDFGVSSYVCFMDTLIDHAEDVKELRNKRIILNELGSDEQAAELFNRITRNLLWNPLAFGEVKESISRYCKSRRRFWWAEWVNTHFRSPWTFFALIAAILALGLTLAQTVFSAIQL